MRISIGIIGAGRFGEILKTLFSDSEFEVKIWSRSKKVDAKEYFEFEEVVNCDVVFPAVPIGVLEEMIGKVGKKIDTNRRPVVVSVCSVMGKPEEWLKKGLKDKVDLVISHPVFGPDSSKQGKVFEGLKWVWQCECVKGTEVLRKLEEFIWSRGIELVRMRSEDHDRIMARTQAMSFLFGRLGMKLGLEESVLDTKGFRCLLENQRIVANDTKELFLDLCKFNPLAMEQVNQARVKLDLIVGQLDDVSEDNQT